MDSRKKWKLENERLLTVFLNDRQKKIHRIVGGRGLLTLVFTSALKFFLVHLA